MTADSDLSLTTCSDCVAARLSNFCEAVQLRLTKEVRVQNVSSPL
jgi:hypothetical protein